MKAVDKPEVAFVLSGGAGLGAIQAGMLRALFDRGIRPDVIVGTSAGALNGAFNAAREPTPETADALGDVWRGLRRNQVFPLNPLTGLLGFLGARDHLVPASGLRRIVDRYVEHERLEELPIPLHVVAVDVITGEELRLSRGPLADAVLASSAIPGVLPPVAWDGRTLMDGGVANNTPISHAIALGARRIYAADRRGLRARGAAVRRAGDGAARGEPADAPAARRGRRAPPPGRRADGAAAAVPAPHPARGLRPRGRADHDGAAGRGGVPGRRSSLCCVSDGLDPAELETFLRVAEAAESLPAGHPDAVAVQRATAKLYKAVKVRRRIDKREAIAAYDDAVTAATATGAPGRIDDETRGLPLAARARGEKAGTLLQPRACYVCKTRYVDVDAFYHQLCPDCAALNHERREARTDLSGRRALLTGGRAKIGMYIALRLLRDGAETTITTRFPRDAARRFAAMEDSADWLHRLRIVGIDLRDPGQVVELADDVAQRGSLDILVNNATQTVRRPPGSYTLLADAERAPLPAGPLPEITTFGRSHDEHPALLTGGPETSHWAPTPHALAELALTAGSASPERIAAERAIDAGGLVPDLAEENSWSQKVEQIDPIELLEVQLCNMTAPFILVGRLRASLAASPARRTYVVNVSAMEGQFGRGYKGPGHPHTNMAKAAVNMLTRTSAQEMFETDGILMTSVDTGWITDERPHPQKMRLADIGFHAPLDLVDGAARVYDPIVRGEAGEDVYGVFLKDYRPWAW
jgi:predicted acylesterase/phospholipase RssA/NAD(P)-dependent dehydrogenase (short-subunit alcohol dehydrogenase family)